MAKKERKPSGFSVRTVKTKEDRSRPSVFMRLKAEESFRGYAIFEPNPEAADNPGYFEYYDHYDKQGNTYVPCAGDKCPFCAANDNPSTRALTVWYFPDNDAKDQIKVFTMNFGTVNDISDESEEEDGILGKKIRIKRLDDRGSYKVKVLTEKPLTQKQLKEIRKRLEELFPNGLVGLVESQLKKQLERLKALEAMDDVDDDDDDDDDEEDEPKNSKSKRGKPAVEDDEDDEDDDDEDEDEDDDEDDDDSDDDDSDDEDEDDDEEEDDDSDDDDDDEEEDEDEEEEEEAPSEIKSETFEVVKTNEKEETVEAKNEAHGKLKMWVGDGVNVDYDAVTKGTEITVTAQTDEEGDWVITKLAVKKAKADTKGKGKGKGKKK